MKKTINASFGDQQFVKYEMFMRFPRGVIE